MSFTSLPKPKKYAEGSTVCIIASRFNEEYMEAMLEHCIDELERLDKLTAIEVQRVPGSGEIPVAANEVLRGSSRPDAVVCLGLLFDGQTGHALLVAQAVTHQLQEISVKYATPIINQVLLVGDHQQAKARTQDTEQELNRGIEAARAAITMINDIERIGRRHQKQPKAPLKNK